jgi:small subunit ribosomal protein S19
MSRSIWKGPFLDKSLLKKLVPSKIWCRSSIIPSRLIGKTVLIHNGKTFKRVIIDREKVGFKFGEFSFTRTYTPRTKSNKNKKK